MQHGPHCHPELHTPLISRKSLGVLTCHTYLVEARKPYTSTDLVKMQDIPYGFERLYVGFYEITQINKDEVAAKHCVFALCLSPPLQLF